jgi:hypothetical protein
LPPPLWEAEDGLAAYERGDPDTLFLGSSHARSFVSMRERLDGPSAGRETAVVPIEWGTMTTYEWAMRHRLAPLMDERRGPKGGPPRRQRLSRAVFVTELYDLCHHEVEIANLPARAWALRHFADDVAVHGLTEYNRNYLETRFLRLFPGSVLVQERGKPQVVDAIKERLRETDPVAQRAAQGARLRALMTEMYPRCNDAREKAAFEAVLAELLRRRLDVTVLVFPMLREVMPKELAAEAGGPPGVYSAYVASLARRLPLRVVDLTLSAPVTAGDFTPDLEHLSAEGGRRLVAWALAHDLAFLREPLPPPSDGAAYLAPAGRGIPSIDGGAGR